MAKYPNKIPVYTIMNIGRCANNELICYIFKNVKIFSWNILARMINNKNFSHIPQLCKQANHRNPTMTNHLENTQTCRNMAGVLIVMVSLSAMAFYK